MREELISPEDAAAELARLDELARVTRDSMAYGHPSGRGLAGLPIAAVCGLSGSLGLVAPAWAFVVLALGPVALLAGPALLDDRYLALGRVEAFTYVAPPGPGLLRAGLVFAAAVWVAAGGVLALLARRLWAFPGLPVGVALGAWLASFLAVGWLGWRAAKGGSQWFGATLFFGILLSLGRDLGRSERMSAFALGVTIAGAFLALVALLDHLHFRKLERRLRALRERG